MIFWILPNGTNLAFIPRTGSTAWAQAILDTFYPEEEKKRKQTHCPKDSDEAAPQFFVPSTRFPEGNLVGVIRDPIERFRSGFSKAAKGRSVDVLTTDLILGKDHPVNVHIRKVSDQFSDYINDIKWYKYETDLEMLAKDLGLAKVPDPANESEEATKPVLTDGQIAKLKQYYSADMKIWEGTK